MNFRRGSVREEPEMNLVPLIDVLMVILIFLMVTTTYSRYSELQIDLPTADAPPSADRPQQIDVAVTPSGRYVVNRSPVVFSSAEAFANELKRAAGSNPDPMIVINADATASHQSVIHVLEAARFAGFGRVTFATQQSKK
jgi:biopolymer transport protein ExbD